MTPERDDGTRREPGGLDPGPGHVDPADGESAPAPVPASPESAYDDEPWHNAMPDEPAPEATVHVDADQDEAIAEELEVWLSEAFEGEVNRYEPDSRRIRAVLHERLDGAVRGRRRRSVLGLRLAGIPAGLAVAVLCGTVAVAVTATVADHPKAQTPTATGDGGLPAPSQTPSVDGSAQAASHGTQTAVSGHPASSAAPTTVTRSPSSPSASATAGGSGPLTATGVVDPSSNGSWSQENVNITFTAPVTSFQLTVKVSTSPGLSSTGDWTNYDISKFDVTVVTQSDGIVYTFQLKSGNTLQPGSIEFAVQFAHRTGHDPSGDSYYASVITDAAHGSAKGVSQGTF